eukprot:4500486-Amphidinium_carterae.1
MLSFPAIYSFTQAPRNHFVRMQTHSLCESQVTPEAIADTQQATKQSLTIPEILSTLYDDSRRQMGKRAERKLR